MYARLAHSFTFVSVAMTALCAAPFAVHAQTVGGQIVGLESNRPVHGANVALVDDSANIVSSTAADTANGMFYIDAPHAGHYRVVLFVPGGSFVSPAMQLDSAQTVERRFSVPDVPGNFRGAYFAQDVTTPAQRLSLKPLPRYPYSREGTGQSALVVLMFVVDEHGRVDPSSVQVINDPGYDFAQAARSALANAVYTPAIKDGASVRQVTQLSIGFGVAGNTPPADIRVVSVAGNRPVSNIAIKDSVILVGRPAGTSQLQPGHH